MASADSEFCPVVVCLLHKSIHILEARDCGPHHPVWFLKYDGHSISNFWEIIVPFLTFNCSLVFLSKTGEEEEPLVSHIHLIRQLKTLQWELEGYKVIKKLLLALTELTLLLKTMQSPRKHT